MGLFTRALLLATAVTALPSASLVNRAAGDFSDGQPSDGKGKGGPLLGGTDPAIDKANPANLAQESTDSGTVANLKWRFSDSKAKIFPGGWVREQVIQDLPQSHDIAAAQQHLSKGAIRELHWHKVVCKFMSLWVLQKRHC